MKTYTIKQRDFNSCMKNSDGTWSHPVLWDCGHKHRTVATATRCLDSLAGWTRSIGAVIIDNSTGEEVEKDWSIFDPYKNGGLR